MTVDRVRPAMLRLGSGLVDLSPAYFGVVMATGIVSLASHMLGIHHLSLVLFYLNITQYIVLAAMFFLRASMYPSRFFGDMVGHLSGPGYFTTVAGTGVLASQFLVLRKDVIFGSILWSITAVLWICLTYTIFVAFIIKTEKPALDKGISGGWLLAVVATQSVSVSSALLAVHIGQPYRLELNLLALSTWLWGGMLYIWMISLIFYRYMFFSFSPGDLAPPYWINMGAMAISTLAGSLLILNSTDAPYLMSVLPFLKGFTIFYWATGTWWIPMLLLLGIWRHIYNRFPLRYDPLYWGLVFPIGMYSAATMQMSRAMGFEFLDLLPSAFLYAAMVAWILTFAGMLRRLAQSVRSCWSDTSGQKV